MVSPSSLYRERMCSLHHITCPIAAAPQLVENVSHTESAVTCVIAACGNWRPNVLKETTSVACFYMFSILWRILEVIGKCPILGQLLYISELLTYLPGLQLK